MPERSATRRMLAGMRALEALTKHAWLLVVLVVTAVHLPALLGGAYFLDVYLTEVHPHLVEVKRALSEGTLPFWSSGLLLGYPLAANPQVGALYLPHLLLLPWLDADQTLVISAWLHSVLGALGAFGLARRFGASREGAAAAGIIYGTAPFLVFYHQAIHGLIALGYLPWIVRAGVELGSGWSRRAFFGGTFATTAALYAGHLQIVLYAGLAAALAAVLAADSGKNRLRALARVASMGVIAVLLYGPQLLPARELWAESLRSDLTSQEVAANPDLESLGPDDAIETVMPRFFGGPSRNDFWYPEFLGAPVVIAAAFAIRRRGPARVLGALIAISLTVLVLIRIPGLRDALLALPGLSVFRAPGRVFVWLLLAFAVLAGLGVDALTTHESKPSRRAFIAALGAVFAFGISVFLGAFDAFPSRDPELSELTPGLRSSDGGWLALAVFAFAAAWLTPKPVRAWALALAIAWPVVHVGQRYNPTIAVVRPPPAATWLATQSPGRILGVAAGDPDYLASVPGPGGWPYTAAGNPERASHSLVADVGLVAGLSGVHAQTSLPLRRTIHRLFGPVRALDYPFKTEPSWPPDLLMHLGVTHVVSRAGGQMPISPRPRTVFERDGVLVHDLRPRRSLARFYAGSLLQGGPDPRPLPLPTPLPTFPVLPSVESYPELPLRVVGALPTDSMGPLHRTPEDLPFDVVGRGHVRIRVDAPEPGVIIFVENAYPGWTATVDGAPSELLLADDAFLGARVPAGAHVVEFHFIPEGYTHGLGLAALGLLLLATSLGMRPSAVVPPPNAC